MDQPIACTLTPTDAAARAEQTSALAQRWLRSREPLPGGQRLRFEASPESEAALREVIAAEAECCAFLRMEMRGNGGEVELDITGPTEARPIIEGLFA